MRPNRFALRVLQNRTGLVPRPSWVTYRVRPDEDRPTAMSLAQIRALFTELGELDLVRLCGPEPLERPDLLEVAETIFESSRPTILHVTTRGRRPDAAEALARGFGPVRSLRILLEVEGLNWSEPGSAPFQATAWQGIVETAKRLRAVARERPFKVAAFTYLEPEMLQVHLQQARRQLLELDVELFGVPRALAPGEAPPHAGPWALLEAESEQWQAARGLGATGVRYILEGARSRCAGDQTPRPRPQCTALRSHIHVNADGSVPSCGFRPEVVGRLGEESFSEMWFGRAAESARSEVDACSGCWSAEESLPNAVYTGDIVRAWGSSRARLGLVRSR